MRGRDVAAKRKGVTSRFAQRPNATMRPHFWTLIERDETDFRIRTAHRCSSCGLVKRGLFAKAQRPPIGDAMSLFGTPGTWQHWGEGPGQERTVIGNECFGQTERAG